MMAFRPGAAPQAGKELSRQMVAKRLRSMLPQREGIMTGELSLVRQEAERLILAGRLKDAVGLLAAETGSNGNAFRELCDMERIGPEQAFKQWSMATSGRRKSGNVEAFKAVQEAMIEDPEAFGKMSEEEKGREMRKADGKALEFTAWVYGGREDGHTNAMYIAAKALGDWEALELAIEKYGLRELLGWALQRNHGWRMRALKEGMPALLASKPELLKEMNYNDAMLIRKMYSDGGWLSRNMHKEAFEKAWSASGRPEIAFKITLLLLGTETALDAARHFISRMTYSFESAEELLQKWTGYGQREIAVIMGRARQA